MTNLDSDNKIETNNGQFFEDFVSQAMLTMLFYWIDKVVDYWDGVSGSGMI